MQSNIRFYIKQTISSSAIAGSTFNISDDFELGGSIEITEATSIVLRNASGAQIERMEITATGGVATIVKRGLDQSNSQVEDENLQKQWGDGDIGYITQLAPNLFDRQQDNLLESGKKIQFGDTVAYIWSDDDGVNLKFKDGSNNEITLTEMSALSGADTKVAATSNDTTPSQLDDKLTAGDGLTYTVVNPSGNESLDMTIDLTDTNIFATDGTANRGVVTDGSGNIFQATEAIRGGVELATTSEVNTGTDTDKAVTPSTLFDNYFKEIDVALETFTSTTTKTITHNLGKTPKLIELNWCGPGSSNLSGFGVWTSSEQYGICSESSASADADSSSTYALYYNDGDYTGLITNVTDTDFQMTFTGTAPDYDITGIFKIY